MIQIQETVFNRFSARRERAGSAVVASYIRADGRER